MKRFEEMNEQELMEIRATMTPEQIKEIMDKEKKELEEHMVKMGFDPKTPIVEEVIGDFDEDDEGGERVTFNPQTGQVTAVESTLLVREKENKIEGGNTTLVEIPEEDFSFVDILVLRKAIKKVQKEQQKQSDKLYELISGDRIFSEKMQEELDKTYSKLRVEVRGLSSLGQVCEIPSSIVTREDVSGEPAPKVNIKKEFEKLDKQVQYQIEYHAKKMVNELLDIL